MTPRQDECLNFLIRFGQENGYSPDTADIAAHLRVSRWVVSKTMAKLVEMGAIRRRREREFDVVWIGPRDCWHNLRPVTDGAPSVAGLMGVIGRMG